MKRLAILTLAVFVLAGSAAAEDGFLKSLTDHPSAEEAVGRHVAAFTETLKKPFSRWLARSGRYIDLMKRILSENDVPEEMAFLSMIESGFNPHAYSRAKAVGPWQFIEGTARKYGLRIDWWVDERRDPVKSTRAAAAYLSDLYGMFGSWDLAMAAYNAGEGRVSRALGKIDGNSFWDLRGSGHIRPETKNYVPKFVAASLIAHDPTGYGFGEVVYEENFDYDEAVIWEPLDLHVAAECAGTTFERLKELNPELTRWCTPPDSKSYILKIPKGTLMAFLERLHGLSPAERFPLRTYTARKGDSLKKVAKKNKLPVAVIAQLNNFKGEKVKLRKGQKIYLPPDGRYKDSYLVAKN